MAASGVVGPGDDGRPLEGFGDTGLTGDLSGRGDMRAPACWPRTAVFVDECLDPDGLPRVLFRRCSAEASSLLGSGESFLTDRADGALAPPPEGVRDIDSATRADSEPGTGEGADDRVVVT